VTASKATFPHVVIRASAGTGKTFQLANRFLGLASAEQPVDRILAATFARKAAGEILDRVMLRLAEAADDPARLTELASHLQRDSLDREECVGLLRLLARSLHRLRIGTLDGFFLQLAGTFSLELGLPTGWQIVDELEDLQMQAEAIQSVLERDSTSDTLPLLHMLTKGETTRSITQQVRELVTQLYTGYRETTENCWRHVPRMPPLANDAVNDALTRFAEFNGWTDKRFEKAHEKHVKCAEARDWEAFVSAGIVKGLLEDGTYCSKAIDLDVGEAYAPLVEHARAELLTRLANQTEATCRLLKHFDEAYTQLKLQRRGLRFDDVTHLLAQAIESRQLDHVDHRLDGGVGHLLLDEFQDTSLEQWRVMRAFAERCVAATGSSLLCVGDVKQAIYGWRGGVSEIFEAVGQQLEGLAAKSLTRSFRSSQPVIDTVNQSFGDLTSNPAMSEFPAVASAWRARFEPHATARSELAGYCRLEVAPEAPEGQKQARVTLSFAAEQIALLAQDHPGRSIGVLVRRNSAVARLIYELRSNHHVLASEEGGNPLTDSVAVQLILSLLKIVDHPGDRAARFHVAESPLGDLVGFKEHMNDAAAWQLARRLRNELFTVGYGRVIYDWVRGLAGDCDPRELSRLMQLIELAYAYEPLATLRTDHFVQLVQQKRVEDPAAADVRVMTIHQAKGLQFDIVVLPELDVNLKSQPRQVVVGRPSPTEPIEIVCRYASEPVQRLLPEKLQKLFDDWPVQVVNESLCLLYVAMTRAVHALHMIVCPRPKEKTHPKTFAGVLRGALAPGKPAQAGAVLFEHGHADWDKRSETGSKPAMPVETGTASAMVVKLKRSSKRSRGLERQTPSSLEGGPKIPLAQELRLEATAAMSRGAVMHAWLERIEWLDQNGPSDAELERAARPIQAIGLDLREEIKNFRRAIRQPDLQAVFSKSAYRNPQSLGFGKEACRALGEGFELQVERERAFALRSGESLLVGSMDRLVLFYRGSQLVAAEIVDFKTDQITSDQQAAERIAFYRPQLEAYRAACAKMLQLPAKRILCRVAFTEPGLVCVV
jgi:ATP-dependent exoDNAse (exonuclease V) beta subunit